MTKMPLPTSISVKYPTYRDIAIKNVHSWLDGKRVDDGAENLWRIHDNLYDLTDFVETHPGGPDWLKWTKGVDITEAFESHHTSSHVYTILEKYKVRKAQTPRNYKFSFNKDGFYMTLKKRVSEKLKTVDRSVENRTKLMMDLLLFTSLVLAITSVKFQSKILCALTGLILTWTTIASHNYFHRRDNWRMYIFNLSLMSYREWRISHALSHHIYTNSLHDLEIAYFEPFFRWIPIQEKSFIQRYLSWFYGPIIYTVLFFSESTKRIMHYFIFKKNALGIDDLIPLIIPTLMFFLTNATIPEVLFYWLLIISSASFTFSVIGLNAAHHHPEITHEGDALRENTDWGLFQLDTVMDRSDLKKSPFLVLTHFGEHALHHLFPTLDHAILPQLNDIFMDTLQEFEYEIRDCSWFEHIIGQHKQLARTHVKTVPKGMKTKKTN